MPHPSQNLRTFIWQQGFALGGIQSRRIIDDFQIQMKAGRNGQSSLAMLDSYLLMPEKVTLDKKIIVIDAGGSTLRCGLATLTGNEQHPKVILEQEKTMPMPGTSGKLDKTGFFSALFDCIRHLLPHSDTIGFCFSYPCEISETLDGKLLRWTKEIDAPGVESLWVGNELAQVIRENAFPDKKIILLNDTVSTLLASKLDKPSKQNDAYIGLILGTGTNCAFSEGDRQLIVNTESGAYDGIRNTLADNRMDSFCSDQGAYSFEKKISGKYLGNLALQLLLIAGEENILGPECFKNLSRFAKENNYQLHTKELNELISKDGQQFSQIKNDQENIRFLLEALVQRAALFSAIQLMAIGRYQHPGSKSSGELQTDREFNILVNVEGSTYYELLGYQDSIRHYTESLSRGSGIHFNFTRVEKASLTGAAIACFSQSV